ncbi:MAG: ADP-ribosylglycohydrolase family protein [Marinobacter sp.]|nr:ADP-ribosylglycohydrolase family protein [Marinobacter sp.]
MHQTQAALDRVRHALETQFVADALAMPVHWYYRIADILQAFPGGVQQFEAPPAFHPSSIMSLHSTQSGGRRKATEQSAPVVGALILKDKAAFWDKANVHYHQGMKAGDNTLNAHCVRVLLRTLAANGGHYDADRFLAAYIQLMTAEPAAHPDTYAESYHRGFFANLQRGLPPDQCAMVTHDTPSVGGLVTVAALVFAEGLRGTAEADIRDLCRRHVSLTHPDDTLLAVCDRYVSLLYTLMTGAVNDTAFEALLVQAGKGVCGIDLAALVAKQLPDQQVVGGLYSPACYITDAWPVVLYLAYKYHREPWQALQVNTNLGGDNVHRGMVLGAVLGLRSGAAAARGFSRLAATEALREEIDALLSAASAPTQ